MFKPKLVMKKAKLDKKKPSSISPSLEKIGELIAKGKK